VNDIFFSSRWSDKDRFQKDGKIQFLYVSNAEIYKNQWHVIKAIAKLRNQGINANLLLIGGGFGLPQEMINNAIEEVDSGREFISQKDFLPNSELPKYIMYSDVFVFASGCENLPITLLEGMATGVPIACSNYGPMPEALDDGGVYFDPENSDSIAEALKLLVLDKNLRDLVTKRALDRSRHYKWRRCSEETWRFISKTTVSINSRGVGDA
jgi:glycosyltransferase involved in cell wall biosynthesis